MRVPGPAVRYSAPVPSADLARPPALCLERSYDLMVVNLVRGQLAVLYPVPGDFHLSWQSSLLTSSSLVGALCGQLGLGYAADRLGRRRLLLISGALTTLGCVGSALAMDDGKPGHSLLWTTLITCRFIMGIGIGGEYPLSASHAAEHAKDGKESGNRLTSTFFFMGVGPVIAPLVVLACQLGGASAGFTWRFAFLFGGAASAGALALRWFHATDSHRFKAVKAARERNKEEAAAATGRGEPAAAASAAAAAGHEVGTTRVLRTYWRPILGTAGSWFLYDIVDYGLGLYSDDVVAVLGLESVTGGNRTAATTLGVLLVNLIALPGPLLTLWLLPRLGRKHTQQLGVGCMLGLYVIFAFSLSSPAQVAAHPQLIVFLFGLATLADALGPGACTYVIPGELFPTCARATCHGLSAAAGKAGAALGASSFGTLLRASGLRGTFSVSALLAVALLAHGAIFLPDYDDDTLAELERAHASGRAVQLLYQPQAYWASGR